MNEAVKSSKCWNCGMTFEVVEQFRRPTQEVLRCAVPGCGKRYATGTTEQSPVASVCRERRDVEREQGFPL